MMGKTHELVGGTTGFVASTVLGFPLWVALPVAAVAVASSSIPDTLEKRLRLSHRKITHRPAVQISVIGAMAAPVVMYSPLPLGIVILFFASVALGCLMHSIADGATVDSRGIQYFWPLSTRGYHVMPRRARVRVGAKSRSEWLFVAVWIAFVLCFLYARFRHSPPS